MSPSGQKLIVEGTLLERGYNGLLLLLTRALERAYYVPHLFFANISKRRRAAPPNLRYLRTNEKYTLCATFDFPGQKIMSPGQVNVRYALRDRL